MDDSLLFATPAMYSADLSPDEWETRLHKMYNRAEATAAWQRGELSPQDFEDALATYGIPDPYKLDDRWMAVLRCRGVL